MSLRRMAIWPTLPPDTYFRPQSNFKPFPLDQENCRIFSLARHAIWNACKTIGLKEGDVILVPAYHHGSEIESLIQAGLTLRYYELNEMLEPSPEELEGLLDENVKAFYIIHYLGFPQNAKFWKEWCDQHQIMMIEDAAQSFLATYEGQPLGSFGQIGVFCLYKTYGIPDGGAVVCTVPPAPPISKQSSGIWRAFKRHFNWVATHRPELGSIHLVFSPALRWLKKQWDRPHQEFDMNDPNTPAAKMSLNLLPKLLSEETAQIRRDNYNYLLKHLSEAVPIPFRHLPEGASPFAFPVELETPDTFLKLMRKKGVMGLLFWINPHPSLPVEDFPHSKKLRQTILALPVHQELNQTELDQIIKAAKESFYILEYA
ncbi:aminotransferase class V-fold PLP-dependent enzyme [Echinicola marina]|uniref:DegT/DnrJ/EryC1/StrS family aminotransferase n=1 Tax=Echinicola marina TaxID=2859768 RepID=UPI001CF6B7C9|nr:DegT/DnrJ/EryC1/StrS family aminotransferase [Echinicola marina]UCS92968.1 aminotransferase class V-fold PLP-dependent enzyme [Echinicola marina]